MNPSFTSEESRLLHKITKEIFWRYCPQSPDPESTREDLHHFGVVGLLEARQSFDPETGTPWLGFASLRIRGAMIDYLRKAPIIRLPQEVYQKVKAVKDARMAIIQAGHEDTLENLAARLGWVAEEVREVEALSPSLVSSDLSEDEEECPSVGDLLTSSAPSPETIAIQRNLASVVHACLNQLSPLNRLVILGRMLEGLKLRELSIPMGCTEENIRIREKKSVAALQQCLTNSGVELENLGNLFD